MSRDGLVVPCSPNSKQDPFHTRRWQQYWGEKIMYDVVVLNGALGHAMSTSGDVDSNDVGRERELSQQFVPKMPTLGTASEISPQGGGVSWLIR